MFTVDIALCYVKVISKYVLVFFCGQPALPELLSKILYHEVDQASSSLGIYFQRQSVLGSLLSITTIPPSLVEGTKMNSPSLQPWITLRGFPQRPNYDELKNLEVSLPRRKIKFRKEETAGCIKPSSHIVSFRTVSTHTSFHFELFQL